MKKKPEELRSHRWYGVKDMLRLSDGRMSGTSYGAEALAAKFKS